MKLPATLYEAGFRCGRINVLVRLAQLAQQFGAHGNTAMEIAEIHLLVGRMPVVVGQSEPNQNDLAA